MVPAFMLEQYLPPPKKPFYRRAWFLVPVMILLVATVVVVIGVGVFWAKYSAEASKFNYNKLTDMEAATVVYDRDNHVLGRSFWKTAIPSR
ncbi:MAG: hypothetical protein QM796_08490 [Chthoniobacteraceae bacterium]